VKAKAGEVTEVAEETAEGAKESVQHVAGEVKDSAQRAAEAVQEKGGEVVESGGCAALRSCRWCWRWRC
jgi:hypothetical protein